MKISVKFGTNKFWFWYWFSFRGGEEGRGQNEP